MKAYTDYPFKELGDTPHTAGPIREVEVLAFDGDKYCTIRIGEFIGDVKWCYLYKERGRCGEVPVIDLEDKFGEMYVPEDDEYDNDSGDVK